MARVRITFDADLDTPTLVEGLPGVGLVGKIATDHLVDVFDMRHVASIDCDGIPQVAIYDEDQRGVLPPVRIYADEDRDLLALQSDVPISRTSSADFADCLTRWLDDRDATPLYLSGLPDKQSDPGHVPNVFGVGTGDTATTLDSHGIDTPPERGVVGGPTGALLNRAEAEAIDAVALVVESDPQFPDPAAAKQLIDDAIAPLADVDIPTEDLVEHAEEIRAQKEQFAQRMQEADEDESSQAKPMRMFQ